MSTILGWTLHEAHREYGVKLIDEPQPGSYDAIILAVAHDQFRDLGVDKLRALGKPGAILFDVKHVFPASAVDGRL